MKASTDEQDALLVLQTTDAALARVEHQLATATAADATAALRADHHRCAADLVATRTAAADQQRAVSRAEAELERVRTRLQRDSDLVDAGASARLQREVEHEVASLRRRITDLEDAALEAMTELEEIEQRLVELHQQESDLRVRIEQATAEARDRATALEVERAELRVRRDQQAEALGATLLAGYERRRAMAPVVIARLLGSRCGGCGLELPPGQVFDIGQSPATELAECEECGCLLIARPEADN